MLNTVPYAKAIPSSERLVLLVLWSFLLYYRKLTERLRKYSKGKLGLLRNNNQGILALELNLAVSESGPSVLFYLDSNYEVHAHY